VSDDPSRPIDADGAPGRGTPTRSSKAVGLFGEFFRHQGLRCAVGTPSIDLTDSRNVCDNPLPIMTTEFERLVARPTGGMMMRPLPNAISWVGPVLLFLSVTGCGGANRVEYSVSTLTKTLLEDKDPNMRYWAVQSLGKLGPAAKEAVPNLIVALKDESALVKSGAAVALGEIGDAEAIAPLREAGKLPEKDVRDAAAAALKRIQAKGKKR
jgi:hypothetical protein